MSPDDDTNNDVHCIQYINPDYTKAKKHKYPKEKKYKKISNEKQISGRQRKQDPVADSSKDWLDQL